MKRQGKLVRWEAARGFGFIRCPEVSADIFVHLRDFTDRGVTPTVGMALTFDEIHVGGKGPRAVAVRAVGATAAAPRQPARRAAASRSGGAPYASPRRRRPEAASSLTGNVFIAGYVVLLGYGVWTGRIPPLWVGVLSLASLVAFFAYGFDKNAAATGKWRTKENTLHLLGLIGGWPGAWWAQRLFHHKTRKASFMATYWATVVMHCAAVAAWIAKLVPGTLPAP